MYQIIFLFPYLFVIKSSIYLFLLRNFIISYYNCNFLNFKLFLISSLLREEPIYDTSYIINNYCNINKSIIIEIFDKFIKHLDTYKINDISLFDEWL